jgi:hypothetical protein
MAFTYKINSIDADAGDVNVTLTIGQKSSTQTINGLPLTSKAEFEAALKAYVQAYIAGLKLQAATADSSIVVGSNQTVN